MAEFKEAGLILEGGANRGIFTAGVLDYLMEQEYKLSYVAGVSAGACNAVDYLSGQIGRTKRCMMPQEKEYRYMTVRGTIRNKSLFDMDMIFDRYPNEVHPFDYEAYFQSPIRCEMVVTNCLTGEAEYLDERKDPKRLMAICRASSSIPLASPMVSLDGGWYLDGGIADSIPLIHSMRLGYRKNVVVLTRNYGYRKKNSSKSRAIYEKALKDYPKLVRTLMNRPSHYNKTLELVEKWEKEGRIFVIRPEIPAVSRTEKNGKVLEEFYQHGYQMMKQKFDAMCEFLESENKG